MPKFLNTSATNYFLEELIKTASDRLILISPFLKLNERIKELLEDKNRLKIDVRVVYGKNELQPGEINWLKDLSFIRTSFCKNLHAKCYINEESCIITSMNLYEFSQVNNNEMGVFFSRSDDASLYRESFDEAQRIIRISDEVRMSLENISSPGVAATENAKESNRQAKNNDNKLTSSKLAKKHKLKTKELIAKLVSLGYLELKDKKPLLTDKGKQAGGEFRMSKQFGPYFIWPESLEMN